MPSFNAHTQSGMYSDNKIMLKQVWASLGYGYRGGYTPKDPSGHDLGMSCTWAPKASYANSENGDFGVYATFHGQGGPADFIVNCSDADLEAFKSCFEMLGTITDLRRQAGASDMDSILSAAKERILRTFSWPVQEKSEPSLFFVRRKEKADKDFNDRVMKMAEDLMERGIELSTDEVRA